jgi:MFS transporter, SP family, inositol transporter
MTMPFNEAMPAADRKSWENTILAGLANYIDGGSIVAGSAALAFWAERYGLSTRFLGLIAAFSSNAIAAGVGALFGGYLCDRFGRKRIYQYDMLFYAFGMLWLVFAVRPWMIVFGSILVGLAVGADIPASWSLIAESAPDGKRGAHSGVAQVLWLLGPLVVLLLFLLVAPLGLLGARLVFAHLVILALLLTFARSRMQESPMWAAANHVEKQRCLKLPSEPSRLRQLLEPRHLRSMAFLIGMYGIWNLCSGTFGFFLPYILRTIGGETQAVAVALQAAGAAGGIASLIFIFMRYVDRVDQRLLLGFAITLQVISILLLVIFPLTRPVVVGFLFLSALSVCGSPQAFYQLWSAELFPTLLRGTAQGITFAVIRIALGIWSFVVPVLAFSRFSTLAWILIGFLVVSGLIGLIWAPRNEGKSLRQIESEATEKDPLANDIFY